MADDPNTTDPQNDPAPTDDAAGAADPAAPANDDAARAKDDAAPANGDPAPVGDAAAPANGDPAPATDAAAPAGPDEATGDAVDSDDPVAIAEAAMRAAGMAVDDISTETASGGGTSTGQDPTQAAPFEMPDLAGAAPSAPNGPPGLDLLNDVNLHVKVELGRTRMYVDDVLRLGPDCIVELDKLAGDPVDIFVNDQLVARGEVLVVNESFCVRVSEIVRSPAQAADDAARQSA